MSRSARNTTALQTSPGSSLVMRATLVSMLIGTVLVVLIGGLRGVT